MCSIPKSKLVTLSCEPKENVIPYTQKLAIHTTKYLPKTILKKITKECEKWRKKSSKKDIIKFINDYKIDWRESKKCKDLKKVEDCVDKFETKNDFFQRERIGIVIENKKPNYIVSPADCRVTAYDNIISSTKYWIKGKNFTLSKLLNNKSYADIFLNGEIIICRLAPDDYHRFHFPIDCMYMGGYKIKGDYNSVNPIIVKSKIDVFGENKREVHILYNPYFGNVFCVIIGAMCTGSIEMEPLNEGGVYKKGDVLGKFGFGGSTIVLLIENKIKLNNLIIENSKKDVETYVRVGNGLGKA